jgi:hypothetical protein
MASPRQTMASLAASAVAGPASAARARQRLRMITVDYNPLLSNDSLTRDTNK